MTGFLLQHLWAHSQRIAQHHSSFERSSFCTFSWNVITPGLTYVALVATCVTGVAQPRKCTGRPLFYLLQLPKTSSNPVNNKSACKIWQKNYHECEQDTLLNYKQHEGKKTICAGGKIILTRHNGVKDLRPLFSTDRTTQAYQLVTCRIYGCNSRIRRKVV